MTLREQFLEGESNAKHKSSRIPMHSDLSFSPIHLRPDNGLEQTEVEGQVGRLADFHEPFQTLQSESALIQYQPHSSTSWIPSVASNSDVSYTSASGQTEPSWTHGLPENMNSCYNNGYASKSAPALPYRPGGRMSAENLRATGDSTYAFVNEDATSDNVVGSQDIFTVDLKPDEYTHPPELDSCCPLPQEPSHSSPRRTSSPSAHPSPSRNRRRSKSAQRRKSAGNLRSTKSPVTMGFVNFTPSDSKRILTGVAPSGSSKTKARREQEASEKKRKLSLAVLKAVEEAGGDPEQLRREGLLMDG